MKRPEIPFNEDARLASLEALNILDSLPESDYDDITRIASIICNTPIALVSFVDADRQFFKSRHGLPVSETPKEFSFCAHAINTPGTLFEVPDSELDDRFKDNPLVTGYPNVKSYAGMPLVTSDGHAVGTLCVIDNKPMKLSEDQKDVFRILANQVVNLLEIRKKNEQLLRHQKQLALFADEMESFAYAASHDLKEPLRTIKSFIKLLGTNQTIQLDSDARMMMGFVIDGAARMESLINDLLEFSQADVSTALIEKVNVAEIIEEVRQLHQLIMQEKSVHIEMVAMPTVQFPKTALRQVFQNLIINAIKYQRQGERPLIKIEAVDKQDCWEFSVADNGIGIAADQLEQVFGIFKRLHNQKEHAGNGIGLAICKKIITQRGGQIWATSTPGQGSLFYFTILKN